MRRIVRAALVAILVLAVLAAVPAPASRTVRGTLHAVDSKARSVELVTGVGISLRLVRLQITTATKITRGGEGVTLAELKRDDLVRSECHWTGKGLVADRIDKVATP